MERDGFLFGRKFRQVDAGKFAGALGIFQENLAGVLERFYLDVSDGEPQERTDFRFVKKWIAQAFMFLHDPALGVEHERSGKSGDTAVLDARLVAGNRHRIVDAEFFNKFLNGILIVVVNHQSKNLQPVFVFILQLDEVGNFGPARPAPGGPKIQKDDFSVRVRERDRLAVQIGELEVRRRIRMANEADGGLMVFLLSRCRTLNDAKK
jgi:hypothetical protein